MNDWIEEIEKYFDDIPLEQRAEVRSFLDEYYEKKDTHSANSLEGLSDDELGELLCLEVKGELDDETIITLNKCKNLRILVLSPNKVSYTSISFSSLSKLLVLDLYIIELELFFKENIYPNKLLFFETNIQDASRKEVRSFPHLSPNLSNIIYLGLKGLGISNIPDLSWMQNLVVLDLELNLIQVIPAHINRLIKLKELYLHSCQISKLPNEFFELRNLEVLDIANNKLTTLPNEIFQFEKLKRLIVFNNPFETPEVLKSLNSIITYTTFENEIFVLDILKNQKPVSQEDYNYFTLKVPKILQTPMLQYIEFFKDYVEATKGKDIIFDVKRDKEGLVLVTNGNVGVTLLELGSYFQEYVGLVGQNAENWVLNFEVPRNAMQADILRLKLDRQITSLKSDLDIARLESKFLDSQLSDAQAHISFLKELSNSLSAKIDKLIDGQLTINEPNANQLLIDLIDQVVKMLERKNTRRLEDLHNDILTDFLRGQDYYATDQTRSGKAKIGAGEIDIMIRKKNGTPYSIIEAFRLASCGEKNRKVAEHLDKLIHDYDTAGHARNFIIVYAEAKNFEKLWENYTNYVNEINGKSDFRAAYPLISFKEKVDFSEKSSIKIGIGKHRREGNVVEVCHIFINMFGGLQ